MRPCCLPDNEPALCQESESYRSPEPTPKPTQTARVNNSCSVPILLPRQPILCCSVAPPRRNAGWFAASRSDQDPILFGSPRSKTRDPTDCTARNRSQVHGKSRVRRLFPLRGTKVNIRFATQRSDASWLHVVRFPG